MRETLIAEYHQTLARDQGLTSEFFARLKNMMRERRLLYGDREISVALHRTCSPERIRNSGSLI
jgi:hypothetical protein